jgi:hypothetical protein
MVRSKLFVLDRRRENVAGSTSGFDEFRLFWIVLDLTPQASHQNVNASVVGLPTSILQ